MRVKIKTAAAMQNVMAACCIQSAWFAAQDQTAHVLAISQTTNNRSLLKPLAYKSHLNSPKLSSMNTQPINATRLQAHALLDFFNDLIDPFCDVLDHKLARHKATVQRAGV
jgi:hypothetical protein